MMEQWLWAFFGVILYNFLSFVIEKDKSDDEYKRFSLKAYTKQRWDNWILSLLCVPVVVVYGDQLWYYVMQYFEKDWEFLSVLYLLTGAVAELFYFLLKKGVAIIKAVKGGDK